MSAFEFFFSFYGLILGLSVAEVITGLVRVFKQRKRVRIGWLTPALALFVLLDIASFWSVAWKIMQGVDVTYGLLILGLLIATVYFAAASLVTPDNPEDWPDFDAFYDSHKRYVLGGVIVANLLANEVVRAVVDPATWMEAASDPRRWLAPLAYNLVLVAAMVSRDRRINLAMLLLAIGVYLATAFWS